MPEQPVRRRRGQPPKPAHLRKVQIHIHIDPDLLPFLEEVTTSYKRSQFINDLIRAEMKRRNGK